LCTYAYQCDPVLLPLAFLKGLRWTIKYGTAEMTPAALALAGMLFGASLGDFAAGQKYCKLAMKYTNRKTESRTLFLCYAFVMHLSIPFEQCKRPLLKSYELGLRSGDLDSAFWSAMNFLELQMHTGVNLQRVLLDQQLYASQFESHKHEKQLTLTKISWQYALNLSQEERSVDSHKIKGSVFDEDSYIEKTQGQLQYALELQHLQRAKIFSAFWFHKHDLVVELMRASEYQDFVPETYGPGLTGHGPVYFNCSLSCVSLARSSASKAIRKKHLAVAKKFLDKKFKVWSNKGNPNVMVYENLLAAEIADVEGKASKAKKLYESAILLAGKWTLTNYRALSHELAGESAQRLGDDEDARYHYDHAIELFEEWGAKWRANKLKKKVEELTPLR
ncbi:MAG: hypothetical protein SGARI_004701, partial [Bacillariaceae sp.]